MKQLNHILHLVKAGLVFARHDVLPKDQVQLLPTPARILFKLAKLVAGKPKQTNTSALNTALNELGPSYIKLGQFLATRPDFIGKERATELALLQDRLEPFNHQLAIDEVERQSGKKLNEVFATFSKPVAAASIAQVHKATLEDGTELAVKILRPNVKRRFNKDLEAFAFAARMMEKWIEPSRRLRPVEAIRVLAKSIDLEMDLRMEAAAIAEMAENTKDDAKFRVPKVDWQRTTGRMLVMEWIDGIPLNAPEKLVAAGVDLEKLSKNVIQSFLRHAIRDGFFHADMHQGNLFVDPQGNLVAVDFGITGRMNKQDRFVLAQVLYGFLNKNYLEVAQTHFDAGYVPQTEDVEVFAQSLRSIGEPIMDKPAEEISVGQLLGQLLEGTQRFNMATQPQLILLQKTMVVVEGVARSLDPKFNMWTASEPVVKEWLENRLGPKGAVEDLSQGMATLGKVAMAMPQTMLEMQQAANSLSEMINKGEIGLDDDTAQKLAKAQSSQSRSSRAALWVGAIALVVIAFAQIM